MVSHQGFVGIQMKCEDINLTQNSLVQDTYGHPLTEQTKNKPGTFVSGLQVKYEKGGRLTGARWAF